MSKINEIPEILREFLTYHESIKGHSKLTVDEYYLDLRNFFRFIKRLRGLAPDNAELDSISISDVDLDFVRDVSLSEVYDYLTYLSRERPKNARDKNSKLGLLASSRARKIATLRSYYNYLTVKREPRLSENPLKDLDSPRTLKSLPRYLSLDESIRLLRSVDGRNKERDYAILCLFLNCGLRISEIVNLDMSSDKADHMIVLGKGNKERTVFLSESCREALDAWLPVRNRMMTSDRGPLFVSTRRKRISKEAIHHMVKQSLKRAGLDSDKYSSHKLRHTAATLMLKNGVDVRTLQELLGHEHLNTTQIYTHVENTELRLAADANPLSKLKKL
jgi:site-specific recombinase XerD